MLLQFELTKVQAVLENYDPKTKKTGEPCAELHFSVACERDAPDLLAFFRADFRAALWTPPTEDLGGPVPPMLQDQHQVFPIKRTEEMGGAEMLIGWGAVSAPMRFESIGLDSFEITAFDGGRYIVAFRVKCEPTEAQAGRLYMMQKKYVELTVEPPELQKMPEAA